MGNDGRACTCLLYTSPFETLTEEIDSLTAPPDTTEAMAAGEEEPMVPATADESFADFFYNFASDEKLQLSRIVFPLPYYTCLLYTSRCV